MFPDPRLQTVAALVTSFGEELAALVADLTDTLRAAPGIGITAPHIGMALRVVVLELSPEEEARAYINPEIVWASAETARHQEGSISMPGIAAEVERAARVRMRYRDLAGIEHIEEEEGFRAACHQHEIDQLDGIFWLRRLSQLKRERLIKCYHKTRR